MVYWFDLVGSLECLGWFSSLEMLKFWVGFLVVFLVVVVDIFLFLRVKGLIIDGEGREVFSVCFFYWVVNYFLEFFSIFVIGCNWIYDYVFF